MRRQSVASAVLLTGLCAALLVAIGRGREQQEPAGLIARPAPARVLPGLQADGFVQLPNQWRLRPAGTQIDLGDFPVNMALHPDGRFLAVLHAGYREHEVAVVDLAGARPRIVSRAVIEQAFYGLCFAPDGRRDRKSTRLNSSHLG